MADPKRAEELALILMEDEGLKKVVHDLAKEAVWSSDPYSVDAAKQSLKKVILAVARKLTTLPSSDVRDALQMAFREAFSVEVDCLVLRLEGVKASILSFALAAEGVRYDMRFEVKMLAVRLLRQYPRLSEVLKLSEEDIYEILWERFEKDWTSTKVMRPWKVRSEPKRVRAADMN